MIDTHSHLFLEDFKDDLPDVMARAREAGVSHIFMPNIDSTSIASLLRVCHDYAKYCFPMIGLHPTSVNEGYEDELRMVEQELSTRRDEYVGIGEIGMDLYWDQTYVAEQQIALKRQLDWALAYDLPVVIHCREAFSYIYKVLESYRHTPLRGIFHSFTGTVDDAEKLLEYTGFMLGINGVVTFKKSTLAEVLKKAVPIGRIVLETDSPYLAPVPYRGTRNESAYIVKVAEKLSDVYGKPLGDIASITSSNALKVFRKHREAF